jgi:uncharacterized caspase-like protein
MFLRLFLLLLAALLFSSDRLHAEHRVALVLGNGKYQNAVKLPNPPADALAMAGLLKSLGFDVVTGIDLGREATGQKMSEFAKISAGADVAVFFYAGHGFQLGGKNLLVPVDANVKSELDAKFSAIEIDTLLEQTMADAKVKIVLLDACRDNPFAKQILASVPKTRSVTLNAGLAEMKPGEGTLVAFATGPGQVAIDGEGAHSPFTNALLTHLPVPGMEIQQALTLVRAQVAEETNKQQLPWGNTNLTGFFYMSMPAVAPTAEPASGRTGGPAFDPRSMELELWSAIKTSSNANDYKAYLERYPNGTFSHIAANRVASLSQQKGPSQPVSGPPLSVEMSFAAGIKFDQPVKFDAPEIQNRSLKQILADGHPLFPPVNGLPDELWKNSNCTGCHKWDRQRFCDQGQAYVQNPNVIGRIAHPLGPQFKVALMNWAKGGCQ